MLWSLISLFFRLFYPKMLFIYLFRRISVTKILTKTTIKMNFSYLLVLRAELDCVLQGIGYSRRDFSIKHPSVRLR